MTDPIALTFSAFALAISAVTAWLTLFRRGTVKMTQPTTIFFGYDTSRSTDDVPSPKVYLRTLLFSTSKRGRIVKNMYLTLSRNEMRQNFNIWVYGEREKLVRGSGLFVGETGVSANHHFLAPIDAKSFQFTPGTYRIQAFAHLLGDRNRVLLFSQTLNVNHECAAKIGKRGTGIYFDWGPDASEYTHHVDERPPSLDPEELIEILRQVQSETGHRAKFDDK